MKQIKIGLIKPFECPDDHIAEWWQLGHFSYTMDELAETNFHRHKIWTQTLILYNSVSSLINNKLSTGITHVVNVPFWASDANNADWNITLINRIKQIDPFFADAEIFTYEVDETLNKPYFFKNNLGDFVMMPDGVLMTKQEYLDIPNNTAIESQSNITLIP